MWPTPARYRGVEVLDDPLTDDHVRHRSMADLVRSNALFGGTRSTIRALRHVWPTLPTRAFLLDVGTGLGDIPLAAARDARSRGVTLEIIGLDRSETLLRIAQPRIAGAIAGDATRLPVADGSADLVTCSQLLHHFVERDVIGVITELHRVSRGWVIISDLRRSWLAAVSFWLASIALRFHAATRHDGVTSVLRGFTPGELERFVVAATGVRPSIRRGWFWRVSASWRARAG
jgi:2-polyprenyl-3-methyl-5-hydroxy-6-metoxy-1,4-benzoquinol methylase